MKLTIYCCLCSATHEAEVNLPAGWAHRYGSVEDEHNGFCPEHSHVAEFAASQCPGCVGGWGECPMWEAFAYSGKRRNVGADDFKKLEAGVCPRRVNGTISFNAGVIHEMDISDRAPPEAGAAFAKAIKDYCEKYPA